MTGQELPRSWARRMTRAEAQKHIRLGWGCEKRGHADGVAAVGFVRWYRWGGEVRVSERFLCAEHAAAYSRRYGIPIDDEWPRDDLPEMIP
jgi:hypothetical protein